MNIGPSAPHPPLKLVSFKSHWKVSGTKRVLFPKDSLRVFSTESWTAPPHPTPPARCMGIRASNTDWVALWAKGRAIQLAAFLGGWFITPTWAPAGNDSNSEQDRCGACSLSPLLLVSEPNVPSSGDEELLPSTTTTDQTSRIQPNGFGGSSQQGGAGQM